MSDEVQRPTNDEDREGWKTYWTAQGMAWRTEPEVDEERQQMPVEREGIHDTDRIAAQGCQGCLHCRPLSQWASRSRQGSDLPVGAASSVLSAQPPRARP